MHDKQSRIVVRISVGILVPKKGSNDINDMEELVAENDCKLYLLTTEEGLHLFVEGEHWQSFSNPLSAIAGLIKQSKNELESILNQLVKKISEKEGE